MLPKKLKHDSVEEALLEVRFLASGLPEIVLGRLADFDDWKAFSRTSLPALNLPPPIRRTDPNLQFHPLIELRSPEGTTLVRVGENVLSFHRLRPYCGWSMFEAELGRVIDRLFSYVPGIRVKRMGLRYVNAMSKGQHLIGGIKDLKLQVRAGDADLVDDVNLNYQIRLTDEHVAMVRVASPSFVAGEMPGESTAFIDIDIFTPPLFETEEPNHVSTWITAAHDYEKRQFFSLIPDEVLQQLVEEE